MNIIFGHETHRVPDHFIKLELDTIKIKDQAFTAYCLIETVPLAEFPMVENNRKNHDMLMQQYRARNWEYCESAIESLTGCWNGEVDTFYRDLKSRIENFKSNPPTADWTGQIQS